MPNRPRPGAGGLPSRRSRNRTVSGPISWADLIQDKIEKGSAWFEPDECAAVSGRRRRSSTTGQLYIERQQQRQQPQQQQPQRRRPQREVMGQLMQPRRLQQRDHPPREAMERKLQPKRMQRRGRPQPVGQFYKAAPQQSRQLPQRVPPKLQRKTVGQGYGYDTGQGGQVDYILGDIENAIFSSPELSQIFEPIDMGGRGDPSTITLLDRDTGEKLQITYLLTGREEYVIVVSLYSTSLETPGITLSTDSNPPLNEVVELVYDVVSMADAGEVPAVEVDAYSRQEPAYAMPSVVGRAPLTVGARKPKDAARAAFELAEKLVSKLSNESLYKFHSVEENKVNLWYDNQEVTILFTLTPENRLKINISGADRDDVIIRDMEYYDVDTLADEIMIKLRGYGCDYAGGEDTPNPPLPPSLTLGAPEIMPASLLSTPTPTTIYIQPEALEALMLHAAKIKGEDELSSYCTEVLALGKAGEYFTLNAKKQLKSKKRTAKTQDAVGIQSDLVRWFCEWARDYAESNKDIKAIAQATKKLNKDAAHGQALLGIGDFPTLVRVATKKKKVAKKKPKARAKAKVVRKKKAKGKKKPR